MQQFAKYKALYMSFYSDSIYRDVWNNWKGYGLQYIFILSVVVSVLLGGVWINKAYNFKSEDVAHIVVDRLFDNPDMTFEQSLNRILDIMAQIPDARINNGITSTPKNEPYFITDPIDSSNLAVIDVSGKYNNLEEVNSDILLSRTRLIISSEKGEDVTYLAKIDEITGLSEKEFNLIFSTLSQIPKMVVENGEVKSDVPMPYYLLNNDGKPFAAIDTSGVINEITKDDEINLLITKDSIYLKDYIDGKIKSVYISDLNSEIIFNSLVSGLNSLKTVIYWAIPLLFVPILAVMSFFFTSFIMVIYATCTLFLGNAMRVSGMDFEKSARISAVAMTPAAFLNVIAASMFTYQGLVYFVVSMGYIYFALRVNKAAN